MLVSHRGLLPDACTLVCRDEELLALLDVEGLVPSVDVGQGCVDARAARGVRIGGDDHLDILRTHVGSPYAGPREEEALLRRETVLHAEVLHLERVLQGTEGDVETAVVADVLAERQLTVDLAARHGL